MTIATYKWTTENYHKAIDAGLFATDRLELLAGEIIIMAPEREPHAYYNDETATYLRSLLGDRAKVRDGKPITLPNNSEPLPDLAIVEPLGRTYLNHHPYAQNIYWLIEFSSATLTKDLTLKQTLYAQAGIPEYWVVNLRDRQLHVFRDPQNGGYATTFMLKNGQLNPLAFPDLDVDVQQLMQ